MTITSADGTRIAVRRMGAGDPVVALHGSGGGLSSFAALTERMGDRFELWGVARRGHGPSDRSAASNTFEAEVADVAAVLAAAGRPGHLLGVSSGAILALHTALADPDEERRAAAGTLSDFEALVADSGDVARWSGLSLPTLLLQGTETWEPVPTSFEALARVLPHAERVALEGQSHFAFSTAPEMVADALLSFFVTRGGSASSP